MEALRLVAVVCVLCLQHAQATQGKQRWHMPGADTVRSRVGSYLGGLGATIPGVGPIVGVATAAATAAQSNWHTIEFDTKRLCVKNADENQLAILTLGGTDLMQLKGKRIGTKTKAGRITDVHIDENNRKTYPLTQMNHNDYSRPTVLRPGSFKQSYSWFQYDPDEVCWVNEMNLYAFRDKFKQKGQDLPGGPVGQHCSKQINAMIDLVIRTRNPKKFAEEMLAEAGLDTVVNKYSSWRMKYATYKGLGKNALDISEVLGKDMRKTITDSKLGKIMDKVKTKTSAWKVVKGLGKLAKLLPFISAGWTLVDLASTKLKNQDCSHLSGFLEAVIRLITMVDASAIKFVTSGEEKFKLERNW